MSLARLHHSDCLVCNDEDCSGTGPNSDIFAWVSGVAARMMSLGISTAPRVFIGGEHDKADVGTKTDTE